MDVTQIIRNGFKNKNIRFIVFRYFIYAVQFGNSLFIAKNLGPFFLGEFGFITLMIQYLTQINFGIPSAMNIKIATDEGKNPVRQKEYLANSFVFTTFHSVLIIILVIVLVYLELPFFKKYDFYTYIYLVAFSAILQNLGVLFIHVFRVKNLLKPITLYQSIMPITNLIACFFWREKELLYALLISQVFSYFVAFIVFILSTPIKLKFRINFSFQRQLIKTGLSLMIYSASFYFIMIITRTFVSYYYSVKDLGYFSFALSFAQSSFLVLDTISFLLFPKLVNRLKSNEGDQSEVLKKMQFVRSNYNLIAFLLIFSTILIFPLILTFLPNYANSFKPFTILSICLALLSGNFGITTFFISNGKEFLLSRIALVAFLFNFGLVWVLTISSLPFFMLCFAPLITYIIYSCLLGYFYKVVFFKEKNILGLFSNFDLRLIFPALLLATAVIINSKPVQISAYISVILLNLKRIKGLLPIFKSLINNPALFKI